VLTVEGTYTLGTLDIDIVGTDTFTTFVDDFDNLRVNGTANFNSGLINFSYR
jgi:hypothetical protein